jgi:hypothetical protein
MKLFFKKNVLLALVAALATLGLAAMPFVSVSAAGEYDPPAPERQLSNERLERVWARQLRIYERMGRHFDRADAFVERIQNLIDRAEENGKDASAVQVALDAFEAALKDAHPIYESINGLINSHQGFDDDGQVADPEAAKETVQAMRGKFQEIREAMNGTGRALHEAIKASREANPRPQPTTST